MTEVSRIALPLSDFGHGIACPDFFAHVLLSKLTSAGSVIMFLQSPRMCWIDLYDLPSMALSLPFCSCRGVTRDFFH